MIRNERFVTLRMIVCARRASPEGRRFSETRRPHPLAAGGSVEEGIRRERVALAPLRDLADLIIDSSRFNVHELRRYIQEHFAPHKLIARTWAIMNRNPKLAGHLRILKVPCVLRADHPEAPGGSCVEIDPATLPAPLPDDMLDRTYG